MITLRDTSYPALGLALLALTAIVLVAWQSLSYMVSDWFVRDEYSHGMLIPVLTLYLLYQRRHLLPERVYGQWLGLAALTIGFLVIFVGVASTIVALSQFGFVTCLIGLYYATMGMHRWQMSAIPLCLLFFMVPLPHFVHQALSGQLQLWSSEIGVFLVKLLGISVYLEGNVIDLGQYKLQVLEACDGLRYLFPLSTLSFIFAYLYKGPMWQRVTLFAAAVPITVLMNSMRIAMIGVMVEYWGTSMAEGFLHDFQGWSIFLVCVVVLMALAKLLTLTGAGRMSLLDMFALTGPPIDNVTAREINIRPGRATWVAVGIAVAASAAIYVSANRPLVVTPDRHDFLAFPMTLHGGWQGRRGVLESAHLDILKLDDYLMADYTKSNGMVANLYVAYYGDQSSGRSAHSPKTCLPGGGWEMQDFRTIEIADFAGVAQPVNRAIIGKGRHRQLVYYWFEQRGRTVANEYGVKYYLFRDAMLMGRSDGAMVRLIAPVRPGMNLAQQEAELTELYRTVKAQLPRFVPG